MDYLTIALILIGIGALLLVVEILVPTGGILVAIALLFFALGVGTILYYGTMTEAVVALIGLAVGLPAAAFAATAAWRKMSLDTVLEESAAPPVPPPAGIDDLKGRTGKTVSPMRPSGSVEFEGRRVDAMTEGVMLDAGVWVRCVDVRRGQVIVRQMEEPPEAPGFESASPTTAEPKAAYPGAEPKAAPGGSEEPTGRDSKKPRDDFDDFDIGLDKP